MPPSCPTINAAFRRCMARSRTSCGSSARQLTDQPYYATKIRVRDPQAAGVDGVRIIPGMPTQVFIKTGMGTWLFTR